MGFTSPFTAVTGATILASDWNTSGRDNINALWKYTAAGSIVVATSPTELAELAKGTAAQLLRMKTDASTLEWASLLAYCVAGRSSTQNVSTNTSVSWNTDIYDALGWHDPVTNPNRITPGVAGSYIASAFARATSADMMMAKILLNDTTLVGAQRSGTAGAGYEADVTVVSRVLEMSDTDYVNCRVDDNGVTAPLQTDSWFQLVRIR